MTSEQALEELKKYAKDLIAIDDAKEFIKNNKELFLHKWIKVMQYYNYIVQKENGLTDIYLEALDVVDEISYENPSLKEWVLDIIYPKSKQNNMQNNNQQGFDPTTLTNQIVSYITEIKNMQYWDLDNVGDIEWKLQELKKLLVENQSYYSTNLYASLMNDINTTLEKIDKFNKLVNSDVMESFDRR